MAHRNHSCSITHRYESDMKCDNGTLCNTAHNLLYTRAQKHDSVPNISQELETVFNSGNDQHHSIWTIIIVNRNNSSHLALQLNWAKSISFEEHWRECISWKDLFDRLNQEGNLATVWRLALPMAAPWRQSKRDEAMKHLQSFLKLQVSHVTQSLRDGGRCHQTPPLVPLMVNRGRGGDRAGALDAPRSLIDLSALIRRERGLTGRGIHRNRGFYFQTSWLLSRVARSGRMLIWSLWWLPFGIGVISTHFDAPSYGRISMEWQWRWWRAIVGF